MRAMCETDAFDLNNVEEIVIMAELRPLNTEVPVTVEITVSKVNRGTMYAGSLWTYEIKPGMVEL